MSSIEQLRLEDGVDGPAAAAKAPAAAKAAPKKTKSTKRVAIAEDDQFDHAPAEQQGEPDPLSAAKGIVQLFVSSNTPDAGMPYQLQRAQASTGSGFIIKFNGQRFIISNAHCVQNFTNVQIKKYGASRKFTAQVLFIADTCDLAILTVTDPLFWRNTLVLELAGPPQLNSSVFCMGYPMGGSELSITQGVVSRVGIHAFAHSADSWLAIQISAGINSGNSGGPVLAYDHDAKKFVCVGVAFEAMVNANSIGYMISTTVVNTMLESFRTNNPGYPSLNLITQSIESDIQRRSLFIPPLAGLFDYLFDMSQIQSTLLDLLTQSGGGLQAVGEDGKELTAEELQELMAAKKKEGDDDKKSPSDEKTPTEADIAAALLGLQGGEEDEDDEANAEHFIIGQDDEYDYVVFKSQVQYEHDELDMDEDGEYDEDDEDGEDGEEEQEGEMPTLPKPKVVKSPKVQSPLTSPSQQGKSSLELELGNEDTPLYRIKRTADVRPPPPVDLLPMLLSGSALYETQIGICVRNIIPFTKTAEILKVGDVILAIDNIPISSDETILFRENERVRYNFLTTNKQIGDKTSLLVLRGFDIFTVEIPVQRKQSIARLFNYQVPEWLVALGLLFVPLSGNLLEAEFGEEWTSQSPVSLLESLFLGILDRFHEDEQVIILTQVLAHHATEGYDAQQMERLTHVNGERVINMKHLSEILSTAVSEYEKNKVQLDLLRSKLNKTESDMIPSPHRPHLIKGDVRDIAASPQEGIKITPEGEEEEVLEPSKFHALFAEQLSTFSKMNYITFRLQSGQVLTLSLSHGHKHQVEILKLHQIPLPGCSDSLSPMYNMKMDVKFVSENIPEDEIEVKLQAPVLQPAKSAQKAQILSPTPLSPRQSHCAITSPNSIANNQKVMKQLEASQSPEASPFASDFANVPTSPVEQLRKFAHKQQQQQKKEPAPTKQ